MHYMGSKARHAKEIIAITTANRRPDQWYVEPFVGGGNVINKVEHGCGRIANDKNEGMVALLDCLGNKGWLPPEAMTKSDWAKIMKLKFEKLDWEGKALFAFAATGPTFGSVWAGQWAKDDDDKPVGTRYRQSRDAAIKDQPGLVGIKFSSGSYDVLSIPEGSLVYCDPPYVNTTEYSGSKVDIKVGEALSKNLWNATKFWRWCDRLIDEHGCTVYVSEYKGPASGDVYGKVWTPELKAERTTYVETHKALQADEKSTNAELEASMALIAAVDAKAGEAGASLAGRWQVQWEKEVISDFSATRGKGEEENAGKREMEKLFTRAT